MRAFPTLQNTGTRRTVAFPKANSRKKLPPPKRPKKDSTVFKDVVLLPSPSTTAVPTHQTRCQLENCGFVVHAVPIDKNLTEEELRDKIIELFPVLQSNETIGFSFVKSCYGQIITPKLAAGVPYSAAHVLGFAGQGSIYIRPVQDLTVAESSDAESIERSPPQSPGERVSSLHQSASASCASQDPSQSTNQSDTHSQSQRSSNQSHTLADQAQGSTVTLVFDDCQPSTSTTAEENLNQLKEMFPEKELWEVRAAFNSHGTVSGAALALSSPTSEFEDSDCDLMQPALGLGNDTITLQALLQNLTKGLSEDKEKLKVDEEDILNDALTYYKDPAFDDRKRIRVMYRGQPAADTGGVMRHFFTQLLNTISQQFFQGSPYKCPIYNAEIVTSGLMKYIGTIIVHSILQGGPGFPVFSPALYRYIATGDVNEAVTMATVGDCTPAIQHFIKKVAECKDVSELDKDECVDILAECGLTISLTNENKMRVIQATIVHDVISRPKIVLDQLRQGLETLRFGRQMKLYPHLFKELFVQEHTLSAVSVQDVLCFPNNMNRSENEVKDYLMQFLCGADFATLQQFLAYATGSPCLPNFGLGKIEIKFDKATTSIVASTCLLTLTFPDTFPDSSHFCTSLKAVIDTDIVTKSFNSV